MNELIRVLLADDHPLFLEGVSNALRQFKHLQVVAECTGGEEVEAFIRQHPVDVAVLDINMPEPNGLALARSINQQYPHIKVVLLTMYQPSAVGSDTLRSSFVHGYVLKNAGSQVLHEAIQNAFRGRRYIDPKLKELLSEAAADASLAAPKLSSRELEIIRLVIEGKNNREVATQLYLSELTIKTHRKNIYQKLGVSNVAELLQAVRRLGLEL